MAVVEELFKAHLRRGQLLELLEGRPANSVVFESFDERSLQPRPGEVTAIWRKKPGINGWTVPDTLLADESEFDDLLSWSATYMRGMGPLTSQVRIMTPAQLQALLDPEPSDIRGLIGGAVGIVICEVLMHAHARQSLPLVSVSTAAIRSTLSFALLRALHVGLGRQHLEEIAGTFERLRREMNRPIPRQSIEAILRVVGSLVGAQAAENRTTTGIEGCDRLLQIRNGADVYEIAREVLTGSGDLLGLRHVGNLREMTAEERVKLLDEMAPSLSNGFGSSSDRAFALALATFVCRPGFEQQAGLLAEYARQLPEAWLWLGALQTRTPVGEVLAGGDASGWWIAREVLRSEDPLSPPRADVSAAELSVMLRGKSRYAGRLLARARIDVEISPLITVLIRGIGREDYSDAELDQQRLPTPGVELNKRDGSISSIEDALKDVMQMLRQHRVSPTSSETSPRGRKRK